MADIILPQVDLLTSTNDNTNVLVEQNGQINRVNKSLFGSSDAETLNGHAASYFATAASLNTTNTNVSRLTTKINALENHRILLWQAPDNYLSNGVGEEEFTLEGEISNFDELEFEGIWNIGLDSIDNTMRVFPNQTFSNLVVDTVKYVIGGLGGYTREFLILSGNRIYLFQGFNSISNQQSNSFCVPTAIYGIKYN